MNLRNRGPALLIAAGLALFVAACGGGPSTPVDPNANPGPVSEPPNTDPQPASSTPAFPPPPT